MKRNRLQIQLYENYHNQPKLQKRIISDNNFTYRELIKIIKPYMGEVKNILDIGSGVGTIDFYLALKNKNVTGVEISANAVEISRENAKFFNLNKKITYVNASFPCKLPKKQYDMVIFSEVIEHLPDDRGALKDICKVLKPSGLLVITTPSKNAPLYRLGLLNDFDNKVGHLRRYTLPSLAELVNKNGYEVISQGKHEGILRNLLFTNSLVGKSLKLIKWKLSNIITLIDSTTVETFGESNIYIIARKK